MADQSPRRAKPSLVVLAFAACAAFTQPAGEPANEAPRFPPWGFDLTAMDRQVQPGDDFNRYANGAWLDRTTMPADEPIVSLRSQMTDRIVARLKGLMEQAAADAPQQPHDSRGKVGAFYAAYMDTSRLEALGARPIEPELAAIRNARGRTALAALMGRTNADFQGSFFGLSQDVDLKNVRRYAVILDQSGLGLPDRDYYLLDKFSAQKAAYQAYVARMLGLVHWPDPEARARDIVALESRIAKASWSKVEERDPEAQYNPMSPQALSSLAPGFAWRAFLDGAGLRGVHRVVVAEKSAFPKIAAIYADTPVPILKAWLAFTVADNAAPYLSEPFVQAHFEFRDRTLAGQREQAPRWKRAVHAISGDTCFGDRADCFGNFGWSVGRLYTARYFPPEAKAKIEALVADLKAAMRARLQRLDWMGAATKAEALRKLDTYQIKVGYPDRQRDDSDVVIRRDDLVGDVRRTAAWDWRFHVARTSGPVDRSEWLLTPQANNAYNGSLRDIVFPAGILQPPIFDPAADPAVNYGAIGAVIGHEMTHGFDDEGRKLDAQGRLRDWWTAADAAAFARRAKRLAAQYSSYEPVPGSHINGELTLGENIADLGGLNIALEAYHRSLGGRPAPVLNGYTGDQRFFLGWAQAWRGKATADYIRRQVVVDPHSPRAFRVIGPLRNMDAWYAAFAVHPGQAYYLTPDQRVSIW